MNEELKYSVLMSVYFKENPDFLTQCLESIFSQTIPPDEVVMVKDGALTNELEVVISNFKDQYCDFFVYELEENLGLGSALNYGLSRCKNDIVLRMDTDDIALVTRAEKQLEFLRDNSDVSVVGSNVDEFFGNPLFIEYTKKVPIDHEDIKKILKKKNPMNHPSIAFKKNDVINAGGYIELKYNEDYFLWVRMLEKGYIFSNINESLLKMRISDQTYKRRGGIKYFFIQDEIYKYMKRKKIISNLEYTFGFFVRFIFRVIMPSQIRGIISKKLLRNKIKHS